MGNLENPKNLILYPKNIPIDFQGEWIYKLIPADFLEMSVNVSAENIACESSCWFSIALLLEYNYRNSRISRKSQI